jgi:hypothetical protein
MKEGGEFDLLPQLHDCRDDLADQKSALSGEFSTRRSCEATAVQFPFHSSFASQFFFVLGL